MSEQKYTLEEAESILKEKHYAEARRLRKCIEKLAPLFPSGRLPFIDSSTMLMYIYDRRKELVEILQQDLEATPSGE